jgi:hypothetical protein
MSFTDPLSITTASPLPVATISIPKVSVGDYRSLYSSADRLVQITGSHQFGARQRDLLRLDYSKVSPDVYLPTTNVKQTASFYLVFDRPMNGQFTNGEMKGIYTAFKGLFASASDLMIDKLIGSES